MFLTKEDVHTSIYPEIVQMISRYSESVLLAKLTIAESEIETYLCQRYLIRPELEKVGSARNPLLMSLAIDMSLYHLYANPETIPANRVKRYDQAIKMLEMLAKGEINLPGVPMAPVIVGGINGGGDIGWGSQARRPTGF